MTPDKTLHQFVALKKAKQIWYRINTQANGVLFNGKKIQAFLVRSNTRLNILNTFILENRQERERQRGNSNCRTKSQIVTLCKYH